MLQDKNIADIVVASPLQQGMLYHGLIAEDSAAYLEQYTFVINGPLDFSTYQNAWQLLADRQPMLRASFHWEGLQKAYLVIHKTASLPVTIDDIGALSTQAQEAHVDAWLRQDRNRGFQHNRAPLFRVHLHRLAEARHRVTLTLHHAIADGWSLTVLLEELTKLYSGDSLIPETAPSFRTYLEWLAKQDHEGASRWWRDRLSNIGAPTPLPLAGPGTPGSEGQNSSSTLTLGEADSQSIRTAARAIGVTESTLFSACWALVLARYNNLDQVIFGQTVSTRPASIAHVEQTVGLFLNVLPTIVTIDAHATCRDWLRDLQAEQAAARRHDFFPLVEMQALSGLPAGASLVSTMVVWENQPGGEEDGRAGAITVEPVRSYEKNSYALMLAGYPGKRIRLALTYDPALFQAGDIDGLLHQVRHLLLQLAEVSDVPVARLTLDASSATPTTGGAALSLAGGDPWSCFASLADETPEATALINDDGTVISRADLRERSLAIAARVEASAPDGRPLAIRLHPGLDYAASVLAALRLNRVWFALDPRRPQEAIRETLEDHGSCVLITEESLWTDDGIGDTPVVDCAFITALPETALPEFQRPAAHDVACVVFTSGSTGKPKGVELPHRALANRLAWMARDVPAGPDAVACLKTSPAFVDAVCELLAPLAFGYPAVVLEPEASRDPTEIWNCMAAQRISHLILTPTLLSALMNQNKGTLDSIRILQVSGEAFPPALARQARQRFPLARVINVYGSSEVMADATWCDVTGDESEIPIGRPIAGAEAWILNEERRLLPQGALGELMISGAGLAKGYRNAPEQSAAAFFDWTAPNGSVKRLYRTGDMVQLCADGKLLFRGRRDSQMKLRGIRIEPGEIEASLKRHPAIDEAIVTLFAPAGEAPRLVAYVTRLQTASSEDDRSLSAELRSLLLRRLPRAIVPDAIVFLAAMPKTATEKIDRRSLPTPDFDKATHGDHIVLPKTETELAVLEVWTATLGRQIASVGRDFFDVGGNSILMTQLCFNIRRRFAVPFPIRAVLDHPDVRSQAALIDTLGSSNSTSKADAGEPPLVELDRESKLADAITPSTGLARQWPQKGARIFLSGAEGFINAWLLARLLDEPDALVTCLAAGRDDTEAFSRLATHLDSFGLWTDKRGLALHAVAGELGRPRFGLTPTRWSELADSMDVLFHTGVRINFVLPYDSLRATNVLSTQTMIELAATGPGKALHFVGSLGVVDHSMARADSPAVDETTALDTWKGLPNGYLQARWASDRMMLRALERGLSGSVMRMTTVCGDCVHHRPNPRDMFWRLIELMVQSGAVPDGERPVNFVPVDQAADAMIALAKDRLAWGKVHHICSDRDIKWRDIGRILRHLGYKIDTLDGPDWVQRLVATIDPTSPLWQETLPLIGDAWRDYDHFIPILSEVTRERLSAKEILFSPADDALMTQNLRSLIDDGRLSSPAQCIFPGNTSEVL